MTSRPGSAGEHALQARHGTVKRAAAFYDKQVLDHLNPQMRDYVARQEMLFVSTADGHGECDCSFRAGPPGFVRVLDERTLLYPEYRGNGVMASLGNITENAHVGLLFVDFMQTAVGLHVNGSASLVEPGAELASSDPLERLEQEMAGASAGVRVTERWVMVDVVEAYIHCSKHVPLLRKVDREIDWGTDDVVKKGGDFFAAKSCPRPWTAPIADVDSPAAM